MLRLPGGNDEVPPLVVPLNDGVSEAQVETAVGEADESARVKKRRRSGRGHESGFDETFSKKKEVDPKLVKYLIGSVVLVGGVLALALLWPKRGGTKPVETPTTMEVAVEEEETEEEAFVAEAKRSVVRPKLVEDELVPVFEGFLNAEDLEEKARWVRHPEVTLPRMRKFYGDGFSPEGFMKVLWGQHPVRTEGAIRVGVQVGDFENRIIHVVDEDGWKIDWESWVGWSAMGWKEISESRPTEAVMFRVEVSDVSYYNFGFTDESHWSSYRLESLNGEHVLFAYAPRAGELDARLKSHDGTESRLFTLKIRYPEEALSGNQVIVDEILADGWFVPEDPS